MDPPPKTAGPGRLRLSDVPVSAFRRGAVTTTLLVIVGALFAAMVAKVLLAAFLGIVVGVYLRPVYRRVLAWTGRPGATAVSTLALLLVPVAAVLTYGYLEVRDAAAYLDQNAASVAAEIQRALDRLPLAAADVRVALEGALDRAADAATTVPAGLQDAIGALAVAAAVFLYTAFYVLTQAGAIVGYLRDKVPPRYAGLTERVERNARGVLYGAVYATVITQALKALWVLTLLLVFGVPLAFTLALVAFVIGFFPVVGSWTIYLPAAGYLLVFQDAPWEALALVALGFTVSTAVLSLYVRPKLAADQSGVLDFYWMFVGLIAGVFTFGVPGIVLGPLVVGLLKALVDVVTDDESWTELPETGDGPHDPSVLVEERLEDGREPAPPEEAEAH